MIGKAGCWELLKRLSVVPAARVKLFLLIVYAVPAAYVIPAAPDFVSAAYSKAAAFGICYDINAGVNVIYS